MPDVPHSPVAPAPGRRAATRPRRRVGVIEVAALAVPLLTVAALAVVRPAQPDEASHSPSAAALAASTMTCPAAWKRTGTVAIANADGESGALTLGLGGAREEVDLADGRLRQGTDEPLSALAVDDLAAGMVATRYGNGAAIACTRPEPEVWFTGVGAGAERASTLSLTNPDIGAAVADITVYGRTGVIDVPALRGLAVPGGRTQSIRLSKLVPERDVLALRVEVTRGRLGAALLDRFDELGRGIRAFDWMPTQVEPRTSSYLVGLGGKPGAREIVIANPNDSEARVSLKLFTRTSEFAPTGIEEVVVGPNSVTSLDATGILRGPAAKGALAIRLDSTQAVTSTLRSLVGADLSFTTAGQPLDGRSALALPQGSKRLVVAGASGVGELSWTAYDDKGEVVGQDNVALEQGVGMRLPLPKDATLVDVRLEKATAVGAIEVGPPGLAVLPLTELQVTSDVPFVRPAPR